MWNNNSFIYAITIYNSLISKRNCIAELAQIKQSIPMLLKNRIIHHIQTEIPQFRIDDDLCIIDRGGKQLSAKDVNLIELHYFLTDKVIPPCQNKRDIQFDKHFMWNNIWGNISIYPVPKKIQNFQWKCTLYFKY